MGFLLSSPDQKTAKNFFVYIAKVLTCTTFDLQEVVVMLTWMTVTQIRVTMGAPVETWKMASSVTVRTDITTQPVYPMWMSVPVIRA